MAQRRPTAGRPPPHRQGPRPLPLHLLTHASTLMASQAALPLLKSGSLPWRPDLVKAAGDLRRDLAAAGPEAYAGFAAAVADEATARHDAFLAGIDAYRRHPYRRDLPPPPAIWSAGTTRLLDYRRPDRPDGLPVLVVPSLVNRAYVLDLTPRRSLIRDLAARGLAPFLVDWDAPGAEEAGFTLTDYVAVRLEGALDAVAAATGRRPAVIGYCMGGLLALALAERRPETVAALCLLATPWDFHAGQMAQSRLMALLAGPLGAMVEAVGVAPVDLLQTFFAALDPGRASRKFTSFARLAPASARARYFVALEDWANDGVPLAGAAARECLFGWYGANLPARGAWRIGDNPVRPERIAVPSLVVVPERDRIVPPESARPLADAIPGARVTEVAGGHVGMLLARRAKTEVYAPIARWLVRSAMQ